MLYASLAASLLSAFLAMLGRQWLTRYAAIDMRGSAIERSQNRQRKLDGIITWYFDHVMGSLPLMLQAALLLLGCALSKYLWGINTTVASVVLSVTLFGLLFYLFIIAAGITSDSCPYQTPVIDVIRHSLRLLRSAFALFAKHSNTYRTSVTWWSGISRLPPAQIIRTTFAYPFTLLTALATDIIRIGRAAFLPLVRLARRAHNRLFRKPPVPGQVIDNQVTKLDFLCYSWMLQTSLDKTIKVSTLNFLGTILSLAGLDPAINSKVVVDCFDIFSSCFVSLDGGVKIVTRGSEQLAGVSAACFLRAFAALSSMEPTSAVIKDVRERYGRAFPSRVDLRGLSLPITINVIHHLFARPRDRKEIDWRNYSPSADELVPFSRALAQATHSGYYREEGQSQAEVPRGLVHFALRFLSQDPLPLPSVVIDCLTIIATDLGCTAVPDPNRKVLDEQ